MLTTQQVKEQQQRFDCFMKSANLIKIGKLVIKYQIEGGCLYYELVRKILYKANVHAAMYHPVKGHFYNTILMTESITAYSNSCKK